MASRKYTRRTTRDRLIDLLEEAIKLVKLRCVGSEDDLDNARKEFQAAANMKNQAALLRNANDLEYTEVSEPGPLSEPLSEPVSEQVSEQVSEPLTQEPLTQEPLTQGQDSQVPYVAHNTTLKVKKLPSCPGGPKAFNEFLKANRAKVESNLGPNAKYVDVRAEIARRWKLACRNTKKLSKVKTASTPGRVNAPLSLAPEVSLPDADYEDEGLDDTLGMRRISVEGRPLYMTDSNMGLFDRSNDEVGGFVGYLRNGKIVEQDAPNEA